MKEKCRPIAIISVNEVANIEVKLQKRSTKKYIVTNIIFKEYQICNKKYTRVMTRCDNDNCVSLPEGLDRLKIGKLQRR